MNNDIISIVYKYLLVINKIRLRPTSMIFELLLQKEKKDIELRQSKCENDRNSYKKSVLNNELLLVNYFHDCYHKENSFVINVSAEVICNVKNIDALKMIIQKKIESYCHRFFNEAVRNNWKLGVKEISLKMEKSLCEPRRKQMIRYNQFLSFIINNNASAIIGSLLDKSMYIINNMLLELYSPELYSPERNLGTYQKIKLALTLNKNPEFYELPVLDYDLTHIDKLINYPHILLKISQNPHITPEVNRTMFVNYSTRLITNITNDKELMMALNNFYDKSSFEFDLLFEHIFTQIVLRGTNELITWFYNKSKVNYIDNIFVNSCACANSHKIKHLIDIFPKISQETYVRAYNNSFINNQIVSDYLRTQIINKQCVLSVDTYCDSLYASNPKVLTRARNTDFLEDMGIDDAQVVFNAMCLTCCNKNDVDFIFYNYNIEDETLGELVKEITNRFTYPRISKTIFNYLEQLIENRFTYPKISKTIFNYLEQLIENRDVLHVLEYLYSLTLLILFTMLLATTVNIRGSWITLVKSRK